MDEERTQMNSMTTHTEALYHYVSLGRAHLLSEADSQAAIHTCRELLAELRQEGVLDRDMASTLLQLLRQHRAMPWMGPGSELRHCAGDSLQLCPQSAQAVLDVIADVAGQDRAQICQRVFGPFIRPETLMESTPRPSAASAGSIFVARLRKDLLRALPRTRLADAFRHVIRFGLVDADAFSLTSIAGAIERVDGVEGYPEYDAEFGHLPRASRLQERVCPERRLALQSLPATLAAVPSIPLCRVRYRDLMQMDCIATEYELLRTATFDIRDKNPVYDGQLRLVASELVRLRSFLAAEIRLALAPSQLLGSPDLVFILVLRFAREVIDAEDLSTDGWFVDPNEPRARVGLNGSGSDYGVNDRTRPMRVLTVDHVIANVTESPRSDVHPIDRAAGARLMDPAYCHYLPFAWDTFEQLLVNTADHDHELAGWMEQERLASLDSPFAVGSPARALHAAVSSGTDEEPCRLGELAARVDEYCRAVAVSALHHRLRG
jgi:hypothetical protein